jgi:hypothetical protein
VAGVLLLVVFVLCVVIYRRAMRPPEITVSKEITYLTGPLREDGTVDYLAALNAKLREGITKENNSTIPMWSAIGPGMFATAKYREEFFTLLDIAPPPEQGEYFVSMEDFARRPENAPKDPNGVPISRNPHEDFWTEQLLTATRRPWTEEEFPLLANWLAANEKPLEFVVAASQRPRRYDPLVPGDESLMATLLPAAGLGQSMGRALTARAMRRVQQGKVDEAWADLLACHRLARLMAQGPTLVEWLVAISQDGTACGGDEGLLRYVQLSTEQVRQMRADYSTLAPLPNLYEKLDLGERYSLLDSVTTVARTGFGQMQALSGSAQAEESLLEMMLRGIVDWDVVLRMSNASMDEIVHAARLPTRMERKEAAARIEAEWQSQLDKSRALGSAITQGPGDAFSHRLGNTFVALFLRPTLAAFDSDDRKTMQSELTALAFALAEFHADRGSYPERLADLVPQYVAHVPQDLFSEQDLRYQQSDNGYSLYSLGPDSQDDGGKTYLEIKDYTETWDISVRIPAPKDKPAKDSTLP